MQHTLATPTLSRLAAAVRRLATPALVLAVVACDNPSEPAQIQEGPAFARAGISSYKGQILFTSGSPEVFMVDPVTHNVVKVSNGEDGAWSPDYSRISYSPGLLDGLYIMDADGNNAKQLASIPSVFGSVFSPDGQYIAFIANPGSGLQVHKVELATGIVTQLTNLTGVGTRVSWSPDGTRILFDRGYSANPNLFTIAPDGTGLTQLTRCNVVCNDGHYSPDGKQITFIHKNQVAVMTSMGTKTKMLTGAADPQAHWPSWSPDGQKVAYERQLGNQHDIWVVTVSNGSTAPLVTNRLDDTTPNWSR
jgi:TolB protein